MDRKKFLQRGVFALIGATLFPSLVKSESEAPKKPKKENTERKTTVIFFVNIENKSKNSYRNIDFFDKENLKNKDFNITASIAPLDIYCSYSIQKEQRLFLHHLKEKNALLRVHGVGVFYKGYDNHNVLVKKGEEVLYDFRVEHAAIGADRNYQGVKTEFYSSEVKCIIPFLEPGQRYSLSCEIL